MKRLMLVMLASAVAGAGFAVLSLDSIGSGVVSSATSIYPSRLKPALPVTEDSVSESTSVKVNINAKEGFINSVKPVLVSPLAGRVVWSSTKVEPESVKPGGGSRKRALTQARGLKGALTDPGLARLVELSNLSKGGRLSR